MSFYIVKESTIYKTAFIPSIFYFPFFLSISLLLGAKSLPFFFYKKIISLNNLPLLYPTLLQFIRFFSKKKYFILKKKFIVKSLIYSILQKELAPLPPKKINNFSTIKKIILILGFIGF